MKLALRVPRVSGQIEELTVVKWHVAPGDEIEFGEPLVDLRADSARHIPRHVRFGEGTAEDIASELEERKASVAVRVVASETGYLESVVSGEGDLVRTGGVVGVASVESGTEPEEIDADELADFRLVANLHDGAGS